MNKIYKVIWSKVRNCYVAVSEIAKRNGKSCTSVNCGAKADRGRAGMALALTLSLSLAGGGVAWAAVKEINDNTYDNNKPWGGYSATYDFIITADNVTFVLGDGGNIKTITSEKDNNTITIQSGGVVSGQMGSANTYSINAGIKNNRVISAGTINDSIYGGYYEQLITNNSVTINGGTVGGSVFGGRATGTYNVTINAVNISESAIVGSTNTSISIYGGHALNGNATGNKVNINLETNDKGTPNDKTDDTGVIWGKVYGGRSYDGNAGGDGENEGNTVSITGGTVRGNIYGGEVARYGDVTGNKVTIENSIVGDTNNVNIYGGLGLNSNTSGTSSTSNNTVSIGGTSAIGSLDYGVEIYGGYGGNNRKVDQNTVSINGGTIYNGVIYGGWADSGYATNNTLEISGGVLKHRDMFGGFSSSGGRANDNTVTIAGGNFSINSNNTRSYIIFS